MIAVADCGSTKSHWALIKSKTSHKVVEKSGYNPFSHKQEILANILTSLGELDELEELYFYGSGIIPGNSQHQVTKFLSQKLPKVVIHADTDLLAAARALCGDESGLVCILGTGSNSCYYNGTKIARSIPTLGYLLGDEGSGNHIGKEIIRSYFYQEMPEKIAGDFSATYGSKKSEILESILQSPSPNQYLASFSNFAYLHLQEPFIFALVKKCIAEFFHRHLTKYQLPEKVNFVGSIAHFYSDVVEECLEEFEMKKGRILRSPIDELISYHKGKMK
jgi:N-acetylglucosamine kinase-like BadF-type ATPase